MMFFNLSFGYFSRVRFVLFIAVNSGVAGAREQLPPMMKK